MNQGLTTRPAHELAALMRAKRLASREIVEAYLARIDDMNARLNAIVTVDADGAMEAAEEADEAAARDEWTGPLHGLPITVKDAIEVRGMRSTAGSPTLSNHVPEADAVAIQRLRASGAIVIGKTNMPAFNADLQTSNDLFGTTNNPWDTTRTAGGSCGGGGAAVAASLSALEVGSDIAGSIRNPSSHCGVYGFRPTIGVVPTRGHLPPGPGALWEGDCMTMGPIARSVADLELAFRTIAGPLPEEAVGWQLRLPAPRGDLADLRVALWTDDHDAPVADEVKGAIDRAASTLADAGVRLDEVTSPVSMADSADVFERLVLGYFGPSMPDEVREASKAAAALPKGEGEPALLRGARAIAQDLGEHLRTLEERAQLRASWQQFFDSYDLLLCPVFNVAAFPHQLGGDITTREIDIDGRTVPHLELFRWCGIFNITYLPTASIPAGRTSSGLPVGVQVVGPYLEDATVLRAAAQLDEVLAAYERPSGY